MIKSLELKGPSCLTKAADNEPLFVLRANDELAPDIVREWAKRYRRQKIGEAIALRQPFTLTDQQRKKCLEAHIIADDMEDWKIDQIKASKEAQS